MWAPVRWRMCGAPGWLWQPALPLISGCQSLWQAPLQPGAGLGSVETPSCCCLPSSVSVTGLHLSLALVLPWKIRLLTSQWQLSFPFFFEFWDKALPCGPGWSWAQDPLVSHTCYNPSFSVLLTSALLVIFLTFSLICLLTDFVRQMLRPLFSQISI